MILLGLLIRLWHFSGPISRASKTLVLTLSPILAFPEEGIAFVVYFDDFVLGLGGVLRQKWSYDICFLLAKVA